MPLPMASTPAAVNAIGFEANLKAFPIMGTSSAIALEFLAKLNLRESIFVCMALTPLKVSCFA